VSDDLTVNRRAFSVGALSDPAPDRDYWLAQPVEERLNAIEIQRRIIYGIDRATSRLQRIFEVAKRPRR
jgi:hypothetical protein